MSTTRIRIVSAIVAVGALAATSAFAQDTHFKFYGGAGYVAPMSDSTVTIDTVTDSVKAEKHVGWNAGFEGRFSKLLGIEIDYLKATQDVNVGGTVIGSTNFSPLTATLNFHVVHTKVVDFYLGPSYSYVNWGDIELNQAGRTFFSTNGLATDSSNGWGAGLGLDIGLGKHFAITGGLRFIDVALKVKGSDSVAVDPLVGRLGVAVRF